MAEFPRLSNREWDVLKLLLQGKSNKLIASSLGISARTVEFHLKNIYTKFQVSSRIELILKLGNATGRLETEKPGCSTVVDKGEVAENRDRLNSRMTWATSFRDTVFIIGKELKVKDILSKHVLAGIASALLAGLLWAGLFVYSGDAPAIRQLSAPIIVILPTIGAVVGLIGRRSNCNLYRVVFSTLLGVALSPLGIIPIMTVIVLPLGNIATQFGIINPATIPSGLATLWAIIIMTAVWFVFGISMGVMLLFLTIRKPSQMDNQPKLEKTLL